MNETHALRISPGSATSASAVASKEEPRLIRARPAGRPREQPQQPLGRPVQAALEPRQPPLLLPVAVVQRLQTANEAVARTVIVAAVAIAASPQGADELSYEGLSAAGESLAAEEMATGRYPALPADMSMPPAPPLGAARQSMPKPLQPRSSLVRRC